MSAGDLGLLTSFYFLGFAATAAGRHPAGPLWSPQDRGGDAAGRGGRFLVFALAPGMAGLAAGRLLIGVGVSVCLGAAIQALSMWFPLSRMPLLNGLVMAIGGLGAVVVGSPLAWLLSWTDWRSVSAGLAVVSLSMAVLLWFGVPDKARPGRESLAEQLRGTRQIWAASASARGPADAAKPGRVPGSADAMGGRLHARCVGLRAGPECATGVGDRPGHDGGLRGLGLGCKASGAARHEPEGLAGAGMMSLSWSRR
ncbi:MFS transporter [Cupriavidus basilensis]